MASKSNYRRTFALVHRSPLLVMAHCLAIVIVWRCLLALPLLDEIQVFSGSRRRSSMSQSSSLDDVVAKVDHLNVKSIARVGIGRSQLKQR
jgi:hypothetical protein